MVSVVGVVDVEFGAGAVDGPALLVAELVVAVAEQHEVVVVGGAAVGSVCDVVGVAPGGSDGAVGPSAVLVAGDAGVEQVVGYESVFVAEVED